jgi:two-component system chemotaxis response regulator CheY
VTVLVLDDSRAMRLVAALALRRAGHDVVEAGDGMEGLGALAAGPVDCVVCDLNMPRMDGLAFIGRLRALPGHARTPVVMVTTEPGPAAVRAGEAAGVRAWIVKPFRAEQLVAAVAALAPARGAASGTAVRG